MPSDIAIMLGMKSISVSEISKRVPAVIREAEEGETLVVTRRGKPVAVIMPLTDAVRRLLTNPVPDVTWIEDVSGYPYVRAMRCLLQARSGRPPGMPDTEEFRLVGWENLSPPGTADPWGVWRTIFYLKDHDPYGRETGDHPTEAVCPKTLRPINEIQS